MINKNGIPDIIINNKQHHIHWFDKAGNYIDMFTGLDGKVYSATIPYEEWQLHPEIWDLYEKEGITLEGPTPIEDIFYPQKSPE